MACVSTLTASNPNIAAEHGRITPCFTTTSDDTRDTADDITPQRCASPSSCSEYSSAPSSSCNSYDDHDPLTLTPTPNVNTAFSLPSREIKAHLESLVTAPMITSRSAVLLPKELWKPDSQSQTCDTLTCEAAFGIFERRHHCRKCGGIFCQDCSSHSAALLDTTDMPFIYPPTSSFPLTPDSSCSPSPSPISPLARSSSSASIASTSAGPIVVSRVCDDCFSQLRGSIRSRRSSHDSTSGSSFADSTSSSSVPPLTRSSSPLIPPTDPKRGLRQHASVNSLRAAHAQPSSRPAFRRAQSSSNTFPHHHRSAAPSRSTTPPPAYSNQPSRLNIVTPSTPSRRSSRKPKSSSLVKPTIVIPDDLGEYPLNISSVGCKARGGGVWAPKPLPEHVARLSRRVQVLTLGADDEEDDDDREARKRRWLGRLVVDGDIQVRVPLEPSTGDCPPLRGLNWSTF